MEKRCGALLVVTTVCGLCAFAGQAQELNPGEVAGRVAENSEALRAYSWSLRVEATIAGEQRVGLYKVRYDFDGELETTPLDGAAGNERADVLQALGDFLRPYAGRAPMRCTVF